MMPPTFENRDFAQIRTVRLPFVEQFEIFDISVSWFIIKTSTVA
jgi:hypothetical protein